MPFDDYTGPAKTVQPLREAQVEEPWPNVPPALIGRLQRWANETTGGWNPNMTGDQALGQIAFMQGLAHVAAKLEQVARKQVEALRKEANIPSHIRREQ